MLNVECDIIVMKLKFKFTIFFIAYSNYELRAQSLIQLRHYRIRKCPEKSY